MREKAVAGAAVKAVREKAVAGAADMAAAKAAMTHPGAPVLRPPTAMRFPLRPSLR